MTLLVSIPPALEALLRGLSVEDGVEPPLLAELERHLQKSYDDGTADLKGIPPNLLSRLATHVCRLQGSEEDDDYLIELLRGGHLIFPEKIAIAQAAQQRCQAVVDRRQRLQLAHDEREYERMTESVRGPRRERAGGPSDIQATLKFQAAVGANMVLAAGSMFGLCYWASKYWLDKTAHRLAAGLAGAFLIMVVEMTVFIIRACKADDAQGRADTTRHVGSFGAKVAGTEARYSSVPTAAPLDVSGRGVQMSNMQTSPPPAAM